MFAFELELFGQFQPKAQIAQAKLGFAAIDEAALVFVCHRLTRLVFPNQYSNDGFSHHRSVK